MKLDPDAIRDILLKIETEQLGPEWQWEITSDEN
jgi:hypothetical protein